MFSELKAVGLMFAFYESNETVIDLVDINASLFSTPSVMQMRLSCKDGELLKLTHHGSPAAAAGKDLLANSSFKANNNIDHSALFQSPLTRRFLVQNCSFILSKGGLVYSNNEYLRYFLSIGNFCLSLTCITTYK